MFTDCRSKKVVLLAHCLLNQNAISDATAIAAGAVKEIVQVFLDAEVGILQMPCPELCCLGLDRGDELGGTRVVTVENTRIRKAMSEGEPNDKLRLMAEQVLYQIDQYSLHGFEILGVIGCNRSPNCGVDTTSKEDVEVEGQGLFMEMLMSGVRERGLEIPFIGIKGSDDLAAKARSLLR